MRSNRSVSVASPSRFGRLRATLGAALLAFAVPAGLHANRIPAAPAGQLESGVPPVRVFSREALGLNGLPSDLQRLPDGRLLVVTPRQLAIGDGARWELINRAPDDHGVPLTGVAVDDTGHIYAGMENGFGRVEFDSSGHWFLHKVADWPGELTTSIPVPRFATVVEGHWYWHSESGVIIQWNPGRPAVIFGRASTVQDIFALGPRMFLSDRVIGQLFRIDPATHESVPVFDEHPRTADEAISATVPFDDHRVLVGTYADGLRLFDGTTLEPFAERGLLGRRLRVTALAPAPDHHYVAVVEGFGLIYFNSAGEVLEVLDRNRDSRLTRIRRLVAAEHGVFWALLPEGIARVELPSPLTTFQSLLPSGLDSVTLMRFEGKLWFLADGDVLRGHYDSNGRLVEFLDDTPVGSFIFSLSDALGALVAGSANGIYVRNADHWVLTDRETANFRLVEGPPDHGRHRYVADGQYGWVRLNGEKLEFERHPMPTLRSAFDARADAQGATWLELGAGRLGRMTTDAGQLHFEVFGADAGVPDGWVQVYVVDGVARFNIADRLYRFDPLTQRVVPDLEMRQHLADVGMIVGRPMRDAAGHLWVGSNDRVRVFDTSTPAWREVQVDLPPGLTPYYVTAEDHGVVWLHGGQLLARYDPALVIARHPPRRTLLTHVSVAGSDYRLPEIGNRLPDVPFSRNSLTFNYSAPGADLHPPTTFEVKLHETAEWEPQGGAGSVTFNHLTEGDYHFQVRARSGDYEGTPAGVEFTVLPPWYRSNVAFITYGASTLGFLGILVWLSTLLERRENNRLDRLVKQRTTELKAINDQLERRVEENRVLSQAITQSPVSVLITQADDTIVFANPRACELTGYRDSELVGRKSATLRHPTENPHQLHDIRESLAAGETWTGELVNRHADGHAVQVRATISPIRNADRSVRFYLLLEEDISAWLLEQERHRRLEDQLFQARKLESIGTLAGGIAHDFNNILTGILGNCEIALLDVEPASHLASDLRDIRQSGLRAKDLVSQILTFSRKTDSKLDPIDIAGPVTEALRLVRASTPTLIEIDQALTSGWVLADATQIHQVLLNLCTNAVQAIDHKPGHIRVELKPLDVGPELVAEIPGLRRGRYMVLSVADSGSGMDPATLERIFDPFFTTKEQGKGTGLGLSIVQGIIASHRGAHRVRTAQNVGTTFELFFPVCPRPVAQRPSAHEAIPGGEAREILVVDDEQTVVDFVCTRLRQFGYSPVPHTDPRTAIASLLASPGRFAAVVTDLTMPHLSGADLIQQLRESGATIPAVVITGYGRENALEKLHTLSHTHVLAKPFAGDDLARLLGRAIRVGQTN